MLWLLPQSTTKDDTRLETGYSGHSKTSILTCWSQCFKRFAESTSADLRALGLAGLIQQGNIAALMRAERESQSFVKVVSRVALATSIESIREPIPEVIKILGRMASATDSVPYVRSAALSSLVAIHTSEALPYFAALLDSPDQSVRQQAVSGMSAYAANLPIVRKGVDINAAIDRLQNPSRRLAKSRPGNDSGGDQTVGDTDEAIHYFHMGMFQNAAEEGRLITYWKAWWARNSATLRR